MTNSSDIIPQVAESSSDGRAAAVVGMTRMRAYTPVKILVSTVNRKILTNAWLQKGPISAFRGLANCGCSEE